MLRLRVEKNWSFWAQWTIPLINFQELSTQSSTKLGYNHDYSITLVNKVSQHKTLNLQNDEKKPQKATYTLSLQVFSFGKKREGTPQGPIPGLFQGDDVALYQHLRAQGTATAQGTEAQGMAQKPETNQNVRICQWIYFI